MKIITDELERMNSLQKERPVKTYVAKYNGKNLKTKSGKSCWKAINHAKAAILLHFSELEHAYILGYKLGAHYSEIDWKKYSYLEQEEKRKEFRKHLWEIVQIVELK